MTMTIKHFATEDLLAKYYSLHQELYPQLPIEPVFDDEGQLALRGPKLLMLGDCTYVEVGGEWKDVRSLS